MRNLLSLLIILGSLSVQAQQTVGVFQNDSTAFNGYTLFAPSSSVHTYLIDNCGNLINQWTGTNQPGLAAYLLPNGNLLRTARIASGVFAGGGIGGRLEIFDWNNNLLWQYDHATGSYHQHHDVEALPNGNILILSWEYKSAADAVSLGRNPGTIGNSIWPTMITEVEPVYPNGVNVVWEWHMWDHLVQDYDINKPSYGALSDHPELIDINFGPLSGFGGADWMHCNSIDYNPTLDQIVVSSRNLDEIFIIDHSTTTAEAAGHTGGNSGMGGDLLYRWGNPQNYDRGTSADQKLFGQHDASWVPAGYPDEGKITIFNNGSGRPSGNFSSIEMITPPLNANNTYTINPGQAFGPSTTHWTYNGGGDPFFSNTMCGANQLPNGNVLICVNAGGELREVSMNKVTKWKYITPVSGSNPVSQGSNPGANGSFRAYRYAPNYPAFNGLTLTPGNPIELNPLPSNCIIYSSISENPYDDQIIIYSSFYNDLLFIRNNSLFNELYVNIYNTNGQVVYSNLHTGVNSEVDLNAFSEGMYVVQLMDKNQKTLSNRKIIK